MLILLTQCQSPSSEIKKAFDKVDKSLKKSNAVLDNSVDRLYATINSARQKNEKLASKADSIYFATKEAQSYINGLKLNLQSKDSSGGNLNTASALLISTPAGDSLRKVLLNVYAVTESYSLRIATDNGLEHALQTFASIQNNKDWLKLYFDNTPTVAALTMLSKFQNDCQNAASITLADIKNRLTGMAVQ